MARSFFFIMTTKLTKDVVRETSIEVGGKPLIVALCADGTIGFKLKGIRGDYSKIHITKACSQTDGFKSSEPSPPAQKDSKAPSGSVTIKDIFDKLEKEPGMPWPYKSALRKFLRRRFK